MSQYIPKEIYSLCARISLYDPTDEEFQGEETEERVDSIPFNGSAVVDYLSKNQAALPYADLMPLIITIGEKFNRNRNVYSGGNKMTCHAHPVGNNLNIIFVTDIYDKFNTIKTEINVTASIPFVLQNDYMFYGLTHKFLQYLREFPEASAERQLLASLPTFT
jgi:hypothetical protein